MKGRSLTIGTRGSKLALFQANLVSSEIAKHFAGELRLEIIKTAGDRISDAPLSRIGEKGLFVKEIEQALIDGEIDLAVHSMKDMPTRIPSGLVLAGVLKREDPRDAFISKKYRSIEELTEKSVVGTSSLRRRAQILHFRPGVSIINIRGNVDTRVRKIEEGAVDASIMAVAGLKRMGLTGYISEILSPEIMLPAIGQGCIAMEIREDSPEILGIINRICDPLDFVAVKVERALLKRLEGGCQIPVGALAIANGKEITIQAMVASIDGSELIRESYCGSICDPEKLGEKVALRLLERGADRILEEIRKEKP